MMSCEYGSYPWAAGAFSTSKTLNVILSLYTLKTSAAFGKKTTYM